MSLGHARPNKHEKKTWIEPCSDELYSLENMFFVTARALYKNVGCKSGVASFAIYIYIFIPQNIYAAKKTAPHFLIQGILIQCLD